MRNRTGIVGIAIALIFSSCARTDESSANGEIGINGGIGEVFVTAKGAIDGYDAVAYFTEGMPVKGEVQFTYLWRGASWYFSSAANLEKFRAEPGKYAPQYGGYCAYGTAEGHKAPTQPDAWTIVAGKLYLNYNRDVKDIWSKDRSNFIKKADANWDDVKTQR